MQGRRSGVVTVLIGLVVLVAVLSGTWFILDADNTPSKASKASSRPAGARSTARKSGPKREASSERGTTTQSTEAQTDQARPTERPEAKSAAKPRKELPGTTDLIVAAAGDKSPVTTTGDPAKAADVVAAKPGEVPPAPAGTLIVTVINSDTKEPVGSAEVYAPLGVARIAVDGAVVKVPAAFGPFRKLANGKGEATFAPKDLEKLATLEDQPGADSVLVLATSVNMVPSVASIDLARVRKDGGRITLALAPSIEITGVVADPKGAKVGGAMVVFRQSEPVGDEGSGTIKVNPKALDAFEATANAQGEFRIAISRNFAYQVTASADGYSPYTSKSFDFRRDEKKLSIILRHGRSLEGHVYHEGLPVAGADVVSLTDGTTTKTGIDGKFYVTALQDRIYTSRVTIRISKLGLSPIVSDELVNTIGLRYEMVKAASLSGVVMLDGVPAVGATISATFRQGDRDWPVPNVRSGKEGVFTIPNLGDGTIKLKATASNDKVSQYETVRLHAAEARDGVILTLQAAAMISGKVWAKGPNGAPMNIPGARIQRNGKDATTTDGLGAFKLTGLGDDFSIVGIVNRGKLPEHLKDLDLFTIDGVKFFTLPATQRVNTNPGGEYTIEFEVVPFFDEVVRSVTLDFTLSSGGDAEDVRLVLTPAIAVAPSGSKVSDVTETFDIRAGVGQVKLVLVEGVNYTARVTHSRIIAKTISQGQLKGIPDQGSLTVPLTGAMALAGYVRDSAGNAIPDADCTVLENGQAVSQGKTDQHGFFDLGGLKAKEYTLNIFRHSYYLSTQKIRATTHSPAPIDVVLLAANEIRLLVTNANGAPQPGVNVRISRPAGNGATAPIEYFNLGETDGQGKKITNFHWIRNYQVTAQRGNAEIGFVNFDNLQAQNTREFTLKLEPAATITGRVVSETSGQRVSDVDVYARLDGASAPRAGNAFWARANASGEFTVLVPANGRYTMFVRESRAYAASLGMAANPGDRALPVTVPPKDNVQGNWAEVVSVSVPSGVRAGQQFEAQIIVRNRGTTTWTESESYRLGSQGPQDNGRWGLGRVAIVQGASVAPGTMHVFTVTLTAPAAGTHVMQWRMVQDGREWFGEFSQALSVVVQAAGG